MRNHRLRERRLKLGLTQYEVGYLAGWPGSTGQNYVSKSECGRPVPASVVDKVRRALVWAETEPRREREAARRMLQLLSRPRSAEVDAAVVDRMVDFLWEGRTVYFDYVQARRPDLGVIAGDRYLDEIPSASPK